MEREYIGIDLHKACFQACALSATGERRWESAFSPDRVRGSHGSSSAGHRRAAVQIAVEASGPTWAFVDAIVPTGATVVCRGSAEDEAESGLSPRRRIGWTPGGWRMRCAARVS